MNVSRRPKGGRLSRAVVAMIVGVIATLSLAFDAGAIDSRCEGQIAVGSDGWETIRAPIFEGPDQLLADYAVDPVAPSNLYVSNHQEIQGSRDGGCSFKSLFRMADQSDIPAASTLKSIEIGGSTSSHRTLFAVIDTAGDIVQTKRLQGQPLVWISRDGGASWRSASNGLPPLGVPGDLLTSPVNQAVVYLPVTVAGEEVIYSSTDGGNNWELATEIKDVLAGTVESPISERFVDLEADASDADLLWAVGQNGLFRSTDGGQTFEKLQEGSFYGVDVASVGGASHITTYGAGLMLRSQDGGRSWEPLELPGPDYLDSTAETQNTLVASVAGDRAKIFVRRETSDGKSWKPISAEGSTFYDLQTDRVDPSRVYARTGFAIKRSTSLLPQATDAPFSITLPPRISPSCRKPPEPGREEPAPTADEPIFVSNFISGNLVRYDRFGKAVVVVKAPQYSESLALDPEDRVVVATRFSDQVVRYDDVTGQAELISALPSAEGPEFSPDGRLFINDNDRNTVYEYTPPVLAGSVPHPIYNFTPTLEFTEDIAIARAGSNKGNLLVLVKTDQGETLGGDPTGIAVLSETPPVWEREDNLIDRFPDRITALGFAVHPRTGHILVPAFNGSGRILEYDPEGNYIGDFACLPQGSEMTKIDISKSANVYVTAVIEENGVRTSRLVRFDPEGQRLYPDFTAELDEPSSDCRACSAIGVAVPHRFTKAPPLLPKEETPTGPISVKDELIRAAPTQQVHADPPPPSLPVTQINPVVQAQGQTQAQPRIEQQSQQMQQSQSQTNPATVAQRQEEPQLAYVHAARGLQQQEQGAHAMSRVGDLRGNPLDGVRLGLGIAMAVMVLGYVRLSLALQQRYRRAPIDRQWRER